MNPKRRGVLVRIFQGNAALIGMRISLVDPVKEGLFLPDDKKILVQHAEVPLAYFGELSRSFRES